MKAPDGMFQITLVGVTPPASDTVVAERERLDPETSTTTTAPAGALITTLEAACSWAAVRSNTSVPGPADVSVTVLPTVEGSVAGRASRAVAAAASDDWAGPN